MTIADKILKLAEQDEISLSSMDEALTTLSIHIKGDGFKQSIPGEVARAIWILQESLYRSVAEIIHNEPNISKLTSEERKALELNFTVREGSTIFDCSIYAVLKTILKAVEDMESRDKMYVLIAIIVAIFGVPQVIDYFERQNNTAALIEQAKILTQPLNQSMQIASDAIAKSSKNADSVTIGERQYTKTDIENLNKKTRTHKASYNTLDLRCQIVGIKKENDGYKIELRAIDGNKVFNARIEKDDFFNENKAIDATGIAPLIDSNTPVSVTLLSKETKSSIEYAILSIETTEESE